MKNKKSEVLREIEQTYNELKNTKNNQPIMVLDKGWIELQDVMGDDLAIVNAARTSYLGESKGEVADKKLLFYLLKNRHTTPFEMVEFKFRVHAPLVTWWQWVRHRTWSFNAQSGRYTQFEETDYYLPGKDEWRLQSTENKQGSSGKLDPHWADGVYAGISGKELTQELEDYYKLGYLKYWRALKAGVAKEQARLFLPAFCLYYTWVCKVDAHNLMHFLKLRMAKEAQYEIRAYANAIYLNFFKDTLPWTFEAFNKYTLNINDKV